LASVIRNLLVRLGVDADDKQAVNFDRAVAGAKKTMLAAAAAATALGAGLFEITRRVANAGDEAAKSATRIGNDCRGRPAIRVCRRHHRYVFCGDGNRNQADDSRGP